MDLRQYFQKIRAIEATLPDVHAVVVSLETSDGGREGRLSEVPRELAAKLIVQGKARLASDEEAEEFILSAMAAQKTAADLSKIERIQLNLVHDADLDLLRSALRKND